MTDQREKLNYEKDEANLFLAARLLATKIILPKTTVVIQDSNGLSLHTVFMILLIIDRLLGILYLGKINLLTLYIESKEKIFLSCGADSVFNPVDSFSK